MRLPSLLGVKNNGEEGALDLLSLSARLAHALRVHVLPLIDGLGEEDEAVDGPEHRRCARVAVCIVPPPLPPPPCSRTNTLCPVCQ